MHIELKIFPCTASNKRKEIGRENAKEQVLSITKSDSETVMTSRKIKDKGKNSEGVTNDMHIELKIFPCTASNKRKEIGSENTKE